jgi:16S rRNA (cytosine1402-N4)-methyltransferase
MTTGDQHVSVMLDEVVEAFANLQSGLLVDGTTGMAGHLYALLQRTPPAVKAIGLDRDPSALQTAGARLLPFGDRVKLIHSGYEDLPAILADLAMGQAAAILLDLGLSSVQLASDRGFSFRPGQPLDMRFDPTSNGPTAADLLRTMPEAELANRLWELAEVPASRRLAKMFKERARAGRMNTTDDFVSACHGVLGPRVRKMASATLPAQALRMMTNGELDRLGRFLEAVPEVLAPNGRLAVIAFHSGEDRMVKQAFRSLAATGAFVLPVRKALKPGQQEILDNRRSRSARLRLLDRVGEDWE